VAFIIDLPVNLSETKNFAVPVPEAAETTAMLETRIVKKNMHTKILSKLFFIFNHSQPCCNIDYI
jgi:hypothetical protein